MTTSNKKYKYSIHNLSEKQMWVIANALDAFARIKCGQFYEFQRLFDEFLFPRDDYCEMREDIESVLNDLKDKIFGYKPGESTGIRQTKSESAKRAYEMQFLIRQFFARRDPNDNVSVYKHDLMKVIDESNIHIQIQKHFSGMRKCLSCGKRNRSGHRCECELNLPPDMRLCSKCDQVKHKDEFYIVPSTEYMRRQCKLCLKAKI